MRISQMAAIVFVSAITNLPYSLPAPLIPLELQRRHISQVFTGLIMGSFSLGYLIGPLLATAFLFPSCGRKGTAQLSLALLSLSLFSYGLAVFIPDKFRFLFALVCLLLRALEGMANAVCLTAIVSLISNLYRSERARAQSARATGSSLG